MQPNSSLYSFMAFYKNLIVLASGVSSLRMILIDAKLSGLLDVLDPYKTIPILSLSDVIILVFMKLSAAFST